MGDDNDDDTDHESGGTTNHDFSWTKGFSGNAADREIAIASGDTITFTWSGEHNVYKLANAAAFASCDFAGATHMGSISPVTVAVGTTDEWYACQILGHCMADQKLHVANSASSSPTVPRGNGNDDEDEDEDDEGGDGNGNGNDDTNQ